MTNKFGTSDDWSDGDILYADDLLDTFGEIIWNDSVSNFSFGASQFSLVCHSATEWSITRTAQSDIYLTTDSGLTWTSKYTSFDDVGFLTICKDDPTKAFAVETGTVTKTAYTVNSGASWTSKTSAGFATNCYACSFPTTNLIVLAGNDSASTQLKYSTDQGGNWSNSNMNATIYAVDMWNATIGYCVDSSGNIWKTIDGAATWTDTTKNATYSFSNGGTKILTTSATTCVVVSVSALTSVCCIDYYDDDAGTVTQKFSLYGMSYDKPLGLIKTTNGTIYTGLQASSSSPTTKATMMLKSTDGGLTWKQMLIPSETTSCADNYTSLGWTHSIAEIPGTNNIIISLVNLIKIKMGD